MPYISFESFFVRFLQSETGAREIKIWQFVNNLCSGFGLVSVSVAILNRNGDQLVLTAAKTDLFCMVQTRFPF